LDDGRLLTEYAVMIEASGVAPEDDVAVSQGCAALMPFLRLPPNKNTAGSAKETDTLLKNVTVTLRDGRVTDKLARVVKFRLSS
jgi:hypothetical protein